MSYQSASGIIRLMVAKFFSRPAIVWGLVLLSVLAGLTYNNWLLGVWLNPDLVKANGSISEYSAISQPHHLVFKGLDVISGLLLVGLAYAWRAKLWSSRSGRAIVIGTAVLGVANIFDALASLPCSETLDKNCYVPVSISPSHFQVPAHGYSSTVIAICYLVLPLAGLIFAYHRRLKVMALVSLITV